MLPRCSSPCAGADSEFKEQYKEILAPVAQYVASWNFLSRGREAMGFPDVEEVDGPLLQGLKAIVEQLPGTCIHPNYLVG